MTRNNSLLKASTLFAASISLCANSLAFAAAEASTNTAKSQASDNSKTNSLSTLSQSSTPKPTRASLSSASSSANPSGTNANPAVTSGSAGGSPAPSPATSNATTNSAGNSGSSISAVTAGSAGGSPASTQVTSNAATSADSSGTLPSTIFGAKPKWHPGMELDASTNAQDLVPTDDVELAKKQVDAYPDSPEASFILAVALTRTSRVEDALKEVRRARKLAEQKGGADYFDKMIATYEDLLKNYPNENRVRYGLAWAYYMKAYLVANYSRKVAAWKAKNGDPAKALAAVGNDPAKAIEKAKAELAAQQAAQSNTTGGGNGNNSATKAADSKTLDAAKNALQAAVEPGKPVDVNKILSAAGALAQGNASSLPKIPSVMDNVDPNDIPQIRKYYELALSKLDDLLAQKPDDVWAMVYRAHLKAEYTGNLDEAMKTWTACREKFPNNPSSYFFLGEGFLKQGNLKESLNNVSKAVALRAMGN